MATKVMSVVMIAWAVSACSNKETEPKPREAAGTAAGTAAAAFDPCVLLTRDEAQAILGGPVDEATRQEPVPGRIAACSYAASGEGAYGIVIVQVQQGTRQSLDDDLAAWKEAMQRDLEIERVDIGGVASAWIPESGEARSFKDGWLVIATATKTADDRASSIAIVEKALPRLPE